MRASAIPLSRNFESDPVVAPRISVVLPTRNEEAAIGKVLDEVRAALADIGGYEVLVVDTDSTDGTREVAAARGARIISEPRRGYGRAYKTGFREARGEIVVALDPDLSYPPDRIPAFVGTIDRGEADFVSGNRLERLGASMSGMHRVGNAILNRAFRLLFRFPIRDSQSGMWVFRRELLGRFEVVHDGMAFSEELKLEAIRSGARFRELPIAYRERLGEKKIRSVPDATANLVWLVRKRAGWVPRSRVG